MKFSEVWLREWVNPGLDRDALMAQLTMAGLEVDGVEAVAGEFTDVVVARIETCEQHPDADKLRLCTVSDGTDVHQVVCGAPNARAGLITALARVGAQLGADFKIKRAKLRGVESLGMLCSASELGLGDDNDGIMELPEDAPVGEALRIYLNTDDVIVDLDLTPNRGDCLSLKGIAREVGVLNNLGVDYPQIEPVAASHEQSFPVRIDAPAGCPRYLGRVIRNVDLSRPTPLWMRERLRRCGLRSIDPIVDVTNYVLVELGQPMHAFDLNQLSEGIVVRMAQEGERLTLLDGRDVALDTDTLLITDGNGPVAMAGVMGGERSGVQTDTKDVFLECAFFAPLAVAGTARRYGMHTDAAHRYERGVDHGLQFDAVERATRLLLDIVGGEAGPIVDTVDAAHLPDVPPVTLRHARLQELLGVDIDVVVVSECLSRLGLEVLSDADGAWQVAVPSHRFDIAIEEDLVEEVCRVYGYNNIPSRQPQTHLQLTEVPLERHAEGALKHLLAQSGFQEAITYTFIDAHTQNLLDPGTEPLALANPMSQEQAVMRTNMLPGLVGALRANRARQQPRVRLFEVGQIFRPQTDALAQPSYVAGLMWGRRQEEAWTAGHEQVDFFDVKGVVERLLSWAGLQDLSYSACDDGVMHPGQSANVLQAGQEIGRLGRLHPEVEEALDQTNVFVFELQLEAVLARPRRQHGAVSRFPSVRRDLALLVKKDVNSAQIEAVLKEALSDEFTDFRLFDVYEGEGIDSTEKSLAVALTFQSQTATLTDDEVNSFQEQALTALQEKLAARLR